MFVKIQTFFCAFALVFCTAIWGASAAQIVGEAEVIKRQVTGAGVRGNRSLSISDQLFENENISAGDSSHGELRLNDNSKIIVGENSSIKLDAFVLGGSGFSSGAVRVAKGAFRFLTGSSEKGAFRVRTPMSTVGIRGTIFDVYVEDGRELFVLFNGTIQVCSTAGVCQVANRNCDVIEVTSPNDVKKAAFFGSARSSLGKQDVPLADDQKRFKKSWRAPLRSCQARAAMEALNSRGSDTNSSSGQFGLDRGDTGVFQDDNNDDDDDDDDYGYNG